MAGGTCGGWGGHGSHVSGIIGAEGNNAQGVTGMNWDVDLHGYDFSDSSCTTTVAQSMMVAAVNNGVDIVNMSLQWINNNQCGTAGTAATLVQVAQANAVLGQGILWAQRQGQDVLWVFAAGNECRDTIYASPASLVDLFPLNTMAVANVTSTGSLSGTSNFGCLVTVAAPGTGIESTVPTDAYGSKSGTSMAAPMVAGLAALLKADDPNRTAEEIKDCILANANAFGNSVPGHDFFVIDAPEALACTTTLVLPPKVDLVISIDSSGSMGGELALLKGNINTALSDLVAAAPGTDFQFGVVSYEDYVGSFSSLACGSTYVAQYSDNAKPDSAFRIEQTMTSNVGTVQTAVNNVTQGSGVDLPQSYGRVYWELAQSDTAVTMGFRSDALRIVLDFGDDVPHDTDLNEGIFMPPIPTLDTGVDPGRNNTIDCGGDDIDFQDDALDALSTNDVRLIHVDSSENSNLIPYWQNWVSQTGGAFETLNNDGSIPAGKSLSELIIDLLQAIPRCN
jgi:subtilisin family serine protease